MINIDAIYQALVQQWDLAPGWSEASFVQEVEDRGIASQAEAQIYVTHYIRIAQEMALIDDATWVALQARVAAVGIDRARVAGFKVHEEVKKQATYRIDWLQENITQITAAIDAWDSIKANAELGRVKILNDFPSSSVRDDTVTVVDRGLEATAAARAQLVRRRTAFSEELAALEGS